MDQSTEDPRPRPDARGDRAERAKKKLAGVSGDVWVLFGLALAKLAIHLATNSRYGYFYDELYYIACSEHLDWGYVDHPALIALVTGLERRLLGDSLFALRFLPALAGALLVVQTGLLARELGGRRFAQALSAVAVIVAPIYLAVHNLLTMNAFEPFFWTLAAWIVLRLVRRQDPRLWLLFGVITGIALLNKYSIAFFAASLIAGLLLGQERRLVASRWILAGGIAAGVLVLPNLLWEARHGWPTLELLANARRDVHYPISAADFLTRQILLVHPFTFPVWLAGLYFYLISSRGKEHRALGWSYAILFAVFVSLRGKIYYLAPAYPMLLAAGGVVAERVFGAPGRERLKAAALLLLVAGGIAAAPYVVPVLPIDLLLKYVDLVGMPDPKVEQGETGRLPEHFAYMLGWENMVAATARAYYSLPSDERAKCAIFASDYGQAGAIDFFGRNYGLPRAISADQNYYLWGPREYSGEVVITVGSPLDDLRPLFRQVDAAQVVRCPNCWPDERDVPIFVCRGLRIPLRDFWPRLKCYSCGSPRFADLESRRGLRGTPAARDGRRPTSPSSLSSDTPGSH